MLFFFKYSVVAIVSIFVGTFSAANIVFPIVFGKNEEEAESGRKRGVNLIAPIIWTGIVYAAYCAVRKYLPDYLVIAIIIYVLSFLGTLIHGIKSYNQ